MRRKIKWLVIIGIVGGAGMWGTGWYFNFLPRPVVKPEWVAGECDEKLWRNVYEPTRLWVVSPCVRMTGKIVYVEREMDGDNHVLVRLDPEFGSALNIFNLLMGNNLVTEVICKDESRGEAREACAGYENMIKIPEKGSRVEVWGSLVIDKTYGWTEIHPVSFFKLLLSP